MVNILPTHTSPELLSKIRDMIETKSTFYLPEINYLCFITRWAVLKQVAAVGKNEKQGFCEWEI